ncbi:MAG: peptide chain release factor aRF-1 [Candidatus Thalassarchaeaceae archaeon]|jgi:peptide chain release factor subunit 1|nr:peptide chain release factor aRF-1 [Candidatus Thalassarchaeaceae archaeon]MDP7042418.1 peptide chain release factor aRF-1 [Candidatus Thalassarchaeaceae archaeon]
MSDDAEKQAARLRFKRILEELMEVRGMGTELVTVIIPPERQVADVRHQLANEAGQARNIKSNQTRKHVIDAIESASAALGNRRNAGDKGVAVFTGHVIVGNNKTRMKTYIIDNPPEPFTSFRYRCDSTFETSQLEEMLVDRTAYGLLVIDRGEGAYGIASGRTVHCKNHITSLVPSKHRQGGQSQQRFERLIEEAADKFFKKVTERACEYWLPMLPDLKGIIVGGPGATKDFVINNGYLHHEIQKIVKKPLFDVGYSNESGLRELVQNAGDLMDKIELDEERQLVDRFLKEIMNAHPKATYGEMMIRSALDQGAVDTLLLSEALRKKKVFFNCRQCKHEWSLTIEGIHEIPDCPECNADATQVREDESKEIDLIDELAGLATQSAASVRLISTDSEEGMTLKQAFGGTAALLRWSWS